MVNVGVLLCDIARTLKSLSKPLIYQSMLILSSRPLAKIENLDFEEEYMLNLIQGMNHNWNKCTVIIPNQYRFSVSSSLAFLTMV